MSRPLSDEIFSRLRINPSSGTQTWSRLSNSIICSRKHAKQCTVQTGAKNLEELMLARITRIAMTRTGSNTQSPTIAMQVAQLTTGLYTNSLFLMAKWSMSPQNSASTKAFEVTIKGESACRYPTQLKVASSKRPGRGSNASRPLG